MSTAINYKVVKQNHLLGAAWLLKPLGTHTEIHLHVWKGERNENITVVS